jgi:DNA-directed RNA polymerase specialized sigma24 family protein
VAGDQRGWDALVERYSQQVWDAARRHGLGAAEAAEVCQVAWLRLADHLTAVAPRDVGAWLCAVADAEARRVAGAGQREMTAGLGDSRPAPSARRASWTLGHSRRGAEHAGRATAKLAGVLALATFVLAALTVISLVVN